MPLQPKALNIKSDDLPAQEGHDGSPLRRQETFILYYANSSDESNKKLYASFNSDFSIFLVKIASSPLKTWATIAHDKKSVLLGHQTTGQRIGLINKVSLNHGKVTGIVIDADSIGLNTADDEPTAANIDKAIYSTYHALIRAAINLDFFKIRRDTTIRDSLTEWYHIMMLRALNLPTLDDLNMSKFDFAISYVLSRFSLLENHGMAWSISSDYIKAKYPKDAANAMSDVKLSEEAFKSIKDFKDITKLFKILEITSDDNMKQIQHMLKKIGTAGFITVVGPIDYAIAGIIISMYFKEYSGLLMNTRLQSTLESSIEKYLKNIKFGAAQ